MTPEERAVLQRIDAKIDRMGAQAKVLIAERNLLRKRLKDAYVALKSLDLRQDALGMVEGANDTYWSLRDELFHNIEAALGIDEEE